MFKIVSSDPKRKRAGANAGLFLAPLPLYVLTSCLLAVAALRVAHSASHIILHPPQTPPQSLRELVPCAPQPRLQRVFGHAEFLRSFARRITLHFAQDECRAQ